MTLEEVLKEYGPTIGLEPLELDDNGVCTIGFGDGSEVHITLDPSSREACALAADCGGVPPTNREAYLRRLLEANFFHRDSGASVIAVEPELDESLLIRRLSLAGLDVRGFEQALGEFAAYQQRWLERAAEALRASAG